MASSSSSSAVAPLEKYDVFISFRGADTRQTFTSYLNHVLCQKKINTFIDDRLESGDEISDSLMKAIEQSKIAVIVFSEKYAESPWCLEELVHILKCKKSTSQRYFVVPLFYRIDPSFVRRQKGSYATAFDKYEIFYKEKMRKVHAWRTALTEAANLSGFPSSEFRTESQMVEVVVENILKKLDHLSPMNYDLKGMVGLEKRIKKMEALLCLCSKDTQIIGIWGMGGIGKTTLAKAVYNWLVLQFEGYCFLGDVREKLDKFGPDHLKKELHSELLQEENPLYVSKRLRCMKVLIVLDDVQSPNQLEVIGTNLHENFGLGSKIIITTRDKQVLDDIEVNNIYEVEELSHDEAAELFQYKAFRGQNPMGEFIELSKQVLDYANGNPLVLKVLSSILNTNKSLEEWKSELDKLKVYPKQEIHNVLRISFDGLEKNVKNIFLDIACFFKGEDKDRVERILDGCGFFAKSGLRDLIDKSLITIIENNKLWMHDVVQEMGWKISEEESTEPENRKRLWIHEDICDVLERNIGSAAVEGIVLNLSQLKRDVILRPTSFQKMHKLRLLKIYYSSSRKRNLSLPKSLPLPNSLRYLHWELYQSNYFPSNFNPENLVELTMIGSPIKRLWDGVKNLENLRKMDMSQCYALTEIPDLSKAPNLESIILNECGDLRQLPFSIKKLNKLGLLELSECDALFDPPKNIMQKLFGRVNWLIGESSRFVDNFPELLCNVRELNLSRTKIEAVPSSVGCLSSLVKLNLTKCKRLKHIPSNIYKMKSLQYLSLHDCLYLESFPEILEPMECLEVLDLSCTQVHKLPKSIDNLVKLTELCMCSCRNIQFLPGSIHRLTCLQRLYLSVCVNLQELPPLPKGLNILGIIDCRSLKSLPELPLYLKELKSGGCVSLEKVSIPRITLLQIFDEVENFREKFEFICCLKLDQDSVRDIIDNAQSRILRMATTLSKHGRSMDFRGEDPSVSFWYPGVRVPKWFNYQREGSESEIELPQYWYRDNFLGIALCVVAVNIGRYYEPTFDESYKPYTNFDKKYSKFVNPFLSYEVHFGAESSESYRCKGVVLEHAHHTNHYDSGVVLLHYDHKLHLHRDSIKERRSLRTTLSNSTKVSFKFELRYGLRVGRWGIRLIYVEEPVWKSNLIAMNEYSESSPAIKDDDERIIEITTMGEDLQQISKVA